MANSRTKPATVISVANQKGGVAKTTSVACARGGVRRARQARAARRPRRAGLPDLLPRRRPRRRRAAPSTRSCRQRHRRRRRAWTCDDGVDLVPQPIDLAGAEAMLLPRPGREYVLRTALEDVDTAIRRRAARLLAEPGGAHAQRAHRQPTGSSSRCRARCSATAAWASCSTPSADVQKILNRDLEVWGILPTLFDGRSNHARRCSPTWASATTCRCSSRRSPRRCASPRPRPSAGRSSPTVAPRPRAPRPTARSRQRSCRGL